MRSKTRTFLSQTVRSNKKTKMNSFVKFIASFIMCLIAVVSLSAMIGHYLFTETKKVGFGKEFIGSEYSTIIHDFGRQPDVIETLYFGKLDAISRNCFSSFVSPCSANDKVTKFTYKGLIHDFSFWSYDNGITNRIIMVR